MFDNDRGMMSVQYRTVNLYIAFLATTLSLASQKSALHSRTEHSTHITTSKRTAAIVATSVQMNPLSWTIKPVRTGLNKISTTKSKYLPLEWQS